MTLKNILVPLMGNTQDTIALDAAGKLALRFGAHLEALHIFDRRRRSSLSWREYLRRIDEIKVASK